MRSAASMDCTHVMPLLRMAALCPMWRLGKRPFFFSISLMARKHMLTATIMSVNNSVFNIFMYICGAKINFKRL